MIWKYGSVLSCRFEPRWFAHRFGGAQPYRLYLCLGCWWSERDCQIPHDACTHIGGLSEVSTHECMSIDTINGNDNTPQDHTEYWRSLTSQGFELIVKGQRVSSSSIQEIQGGILRVKHTKACVFRADYNINPLQGGFWLVPRGDLVSLRNPDQGLMSPLLLPCKNQVAHLELGLQNYNSSYIWWFFIVTTFPTVPCTLYR